MLAALLLAPVVAVLPFKDVSATAPSAGPIGTAIGAVLSADLGEVTLEVRDAQTVASELGKAGLAARAVDLVPADRRRLAHALGVRMLVMGAFQRTDTKLTIWARFAGPNGRLDGTATAEGPPSDFLLLVNTVEAKLTRILRLPRPTVEQVTYRIRPRLRSPAALDRYAAALVEADPERKLHLLEQALDADPTFVYASRALDAIERKRPPRDPVERGFEERAEKEALARWRAEVAKVNDPERLAAECLSRFAALQKARRYHQLIAEARAVIAEPPPPVPKLSEQLPESAAYLIVASYDQLNDDDALLREGQRFLARYPLSNGFVVVRQLVDGALARQRAQEQGRARAAAAIAKLPPAARRDPCRVGEIELEDHQLAAAREHLMACVADGKLHVDALTHLLWAEYRLGHFAAAGRLLDRLRTVAPDRYRQVMHLADEMPSD